MKFSWFNKLKSNIPWFNKIKVALGIPVYNDILFIDQSVDNALKSGFDYIVYLDDGSNDGTYEKLMSYAVEHKHIEVIRNEHNSILNNGPNRWMIVAEACRKYNPDWIMIRAADQTLSYPLRKSLKKRLNYIYNNSS